MLLLPDTLMEPMGCPCLSKMERRHKRPFSRTVRYQGVADIADLIQISEEAFRLRAGDSALGTPLFCSSS